MREVSTTSAAAIMCSIEKSELTRIFAERDDFNRDRFETYVRSATEILLHGIVRGDR